MSRVVLDWTEPQAWRAGLMNDITYIGLGVHKRRFAWRLPRAAAVERYERLAYSRTGPTTISRAIAASPPCRVVRASIAELRPLVFCATCGVTVIERSSLTKSSASQASSAPSVFARGR